MRIRIEGAPRTKKTHSRIVRVGKAKRPILIPSKAWTDWCKAARIFLTDDLWGIPLPFAGVAVPEKVYNCAALIYRDADRGDAVGYYQGLADLLEKRGVIVNDSCLVQWDGSRLLIDRKHPRIELTLTEVAA